MNECVHRREIPLCGSEREAEPLKNANFSYLQIKSAETSKKVFSMQRGLWGTGQSERASTCLNQYKLATCPVVSLDFSFL